MATFRKDIVDRKKDVTKIDEGIKNPWLWSWLERTVNSVRLDAIYVKLSAKGKAYCVVCRKEILYANRGWKALEDHAKGETHKRTFDAKHNNYALPGSSSGQQQKLYSIFSKSESETNQTTNQPELYTPVVDRLRNAEAMLLSFIAEHSLSFSLAPRLISLTKSLAADKKALDKLSMDRTTASYKTTHGVGRTFSEKLISDLQKSYFSLNIDEATSSNSYRVLSVLVGYLSPKMNKVVVHHLDSISLIKVTSENLFEALDNMFKTKNIPWENLMSVLMDSCAVMRGSKNGLYQLIKTRRAPHILDIDGDTCHHAHNAAKAFCKPFDRHVECLLSDLFTDFLWSADFREALQTICSVLGVKYTTPQRYVPTRWLSVYDVSVDTIRLFPAYTLFYGVFLPEKEKSVYSDYMKEINTQFHISGENQAAIKSLMGKVMKKGMTKEGKERKNRIVEKMFYQRQKTSLILEIYAAVLPLLKKYVVMFQAKESRIDRLHDEQRELLINFLKCFVKPEVMADLTTKKLASLSLSDKSICLPPRSMFIGFKARKHIESGEMEKFLITVRDAYVNCGICLQAKMPLNNVLLRCLSALDPVVRQHVTALTHLCKLPAMLPNVIGDEERDEYDLQVRSYCNDKLPDGNDESLDEWWGQLAPKYPVLGKVVKALLSCFHGPAVEGTFNVMGDVMDDRSSRMNIETYSAIQTIKHELKAQNVTAVQMFHQEDPLHAKVDPALCHNLSKAYETYESHKEGRKQTEANSLAEQGVTVSKRVPIPKRKANNLIYIASKKARAAHTASLKEHFK